MRKHPRKPGVTFSIRRIVRRFGMRLIGHLALLWYILMAGIHLVVALSGQESFWSFRIRNYLSAYL